MSTPSVDSICEALRKNVLSGVLTNWEAYELANDIATELEKNRTGTDEFLRVEASRYFARASLQSVTQGMEGEGNDELLVTTEIEIVVFGGRDHYDRTEEATLFLEAMCDNKADYGYVSVGQYETKTLPSGGVVFRYF